MAFNALAVPTLYPSEISKISKISNGTTSNLIADDVDLNRIYVMPPNRAEASASGFHTMNMNLNFCGEISDLAKYMRSIEQKKTQLAQEDADSASRVDKIRRDLFQARKDAADYIASKDLVLLDNLDSELKDVEERLVLLYDKLEKCQDSCAPISAEMKALNERKRNLQNDRRELSKQRVADVRQYEKLKTKVEQISINLTDEEESFKKVRDRLTAVKKELFETYSTYGRMEGGRAAFNYRSSWDQNVQRLRDANPGFSFEKIQTANAKVASSLIGLNSTISGSAVLGYEMAGSTASNGILELPSFPEDFSTNVVLSLLGACPIVHPESFEVQGPKPTVDQMKYGLTIAYEFPSNFRLSATANYNMHKMYKKTAESGSSGGFFSSRSWTNVSEQTDFTDAFRVAWKEQDPSNTIDEKSRILVEQEMKLDIYNRMAIYAAIQSPDRAGTMSPMNPPTHGAVVLSSGLMNTCPGNAYCVGGAIALQVLDAIFGNSSAVASYTQRQDFDLTNSWSRDKVSLKPWITVYTP